VLQSVRPKLVGICASFTCRIHNRIPPSSQLGDDLGPKALKALPRRRREENEATELSTGME
jgi:hypothetical protein